jgi:uncharacterized protein (TIGR00369 family)
LTSTGADATVPDDRDGFFEVIGGRYEQLTPDLAVGTLEVGPQHHQPHGLVNGGVYCTMVESLGSMGGAVWGASQDGIHGVVGVHNSTDFLRGHRDGPLRGEATPIHRGRTQQLWQVVITRQADGKVVARGQVRLQNILDPAVIGASDTKPTA